MTPFEIGKTYKTKGGWTATVVWKEPKIKTMWCVHHDPAFFEMGEEYNGNPNTPPIPHTTYSGEPVVNREGWYIASIFGENPNTILPELAVDTFSHAENS